MPKGLHHEVMKRDSCTSWLNGSSQPQFFAATWFDPLATSMPQGVHHEVMKKPMHFMASMVRASHSSSRPHGSIRWPRQCRKGVHHEVMKRNPCTSWVHGSGDPQFFTA